MIFHSPKIPIPIPPIETFMASFVISYHQHSMNPLMLLIRHQGHQNGGFNPSDMQCILIIVMCFYIFL